MTQMLPGSSLYKEKEQESCFLFLAWWLGDFISVRFAAKVRHLGVCVPRFSTQGAKAAAMQSAFKEIPCKMVERLAARDAPKKRNGSRPEKKPPFTKGVSFRTKS